MEPKPLPQRRRLQLLAGFCVLGVGVGAARYWEQQPRPPQGSPMAVAVGDLPAGKLRTLDWEGRSVWLLRRSTEELAALARREGDLIDPESLDSLQPDACRNRHRSLRPDLFVAIGQCTHQGCPPQLRQTDGGAEFLCPCHTSRFDLAGRVFRGGPAPSNLVIPVYRLDGDDRVVIGEA